MPRKLFSSPVEEPVKLSEAKSQLQLSPDEQHADDDLIYSYIRAARIYCEQLLERSLVTQTWDLYLDSFPEEKIIEIPRPPLQSVTWLKYKDGAGALQTLDADTYIVDVVSEPGRIVLANAQSWPDVYDEIQAVQVRFVCGYGLAAAVPENIKSAIKLKLTDLYANRGDSAPNEAVDRAIKALFSSDEILYI
jgi:uncharacterized phiE125 gp8 family phage protein